MVAPSQPKPRRDRLKKIMKPDRPIKHAYKGPLKGSLKSRFHIGLRANYAQKLPEIHVHTNTLEPRFIHHAITQSFSSNFPFHVLKYVQSIFSLGGPYKFSIKPACRYTLQKKAYQTRLAPGHITDFYRISCATIASSRSNKLSSKLSCSTILVFPLIV